MKKKWSVIIAAAMALMVLASSTTPAMAHSQEEPLQHEDHNRVCLQTQDKAFRICQPFLEFSMSVLLNTCLCQTLFCALFRYIFLIFKFFLI